MKLFRASDKTVPLLGPGSAGGEITDLTLPPSRLYNPDDEGVFPVLEAEWMDCSIADLLIFTFYLLTLGKVVYFLGTESTANTSTSVPFFS